MATGSFASRVCQTCYRRKIKCDKALPKCSGCVQFKRPCTYRDATTPSSTTTTGEHLANLSASPSYSLGEHAASVGAFLDPGMSQFSSSSSSDISPSLSAFMRGPNGLYTAIRQHLSQYFERFSPWLPVISDEKLYIGLLNPLISAGPDVVFLYICIVLHTKALPEDQDVRAWEIYVTARRCLSELEVRGRLSNEILQGCLLIALFELGHAIYPAALRSVGTCGKYAAALGLGFETKGQALTTGWFVCLESEGRKRVWWAVFILDRFANLGNPHHTLTLPDPPLEAILPLPVVDGPRADRWKSNPEQVVATLASPSEDLGRFASVCQTAYLLSCVYRHIADDTSDFEFHARERQQLDNTLHAQVKYHARNIGPVNSILCYQTAFSFSALRLLYPINGHSGEFGDRAVEIAEESAQVALQTARWYLEDGLGDFSHGDVPIFTLPWLYSTGVWLLERQREEDLWVVQQTLRQLHSKWRLAGVYSTLLDARKAVARRSGFDGVGTEGYPSRRKFDGRSVLRP